MGKMMEAESKRAPRKVPAAIIKQAIAARQISDIKKDIIANGFQPMEQHFAAMGLSPEEQAHIPDDLVATRLRATYKPVNLCLVAAEYLESVLSRKDMDFPDARVQPVDRNGGQWLIMPRYFADELMKNLKSGRSVSSDATPSLQ